MTVTAPNANSGIPSVTDSQFITINAGGTANIINPGDLLVWRGTGSAISNSGNTSALKSSAIGFALDRNPAYDNAGRQVVNSALLVARFGTMRVSANFSGNPARGVVAYPETTGSGVNAPSGQTGVGALWQTAAPSTLSGATGGTNFGLGTVINWFNSGPAGTGQMDVVIWDRNAEYY